MFGSVSVAAAETKKMVWSRSRGQRGAVSFFWALLHDNVPGVLASVNQTLADHEANVRAQYELAARNGSDVQIDRRYVRADGSRLRALERVRVLRDQRGKPGSLLVVFFDLPDGDRADGSH